MEEVTRDERLRRLEDMHGQVSLGDRVWAADKVRGLEAYSEQLEKQNRILKEQLSIWKRKAGENQLIAGRYQFMFEEAMKAVNKIDDLFEYVYTSMHPVEIRKTVYTALSGFTEAVAKFRRSPLETPDKK